MTEFRPGIVLPALPEIVIAFGAMCLLLYGVFSKRDDMRLISWLSVGLMAIAAVLVGTGDEGRNIAFEGLFVTDGFSRFMKLLMLLGAALVLIISLQYFRLERLERFEYPVLVLFATLGMLMMVSANDLISLYLGIELHSLSLYVMVALRRDSVRSTEAGLKYFVLGALASGMLLYGSSLIYGFTGATGFDSIASYLGSPGTADPSLGLVVGIAFLATGLAFKVSAVPFHMWTPDVYEGAPTPMTAFLAAAPKVAAMALFLRVMFGPMAALADQWQQIIIFLSIASMGLGAVAAIAQTNIKRLMAYSSIGHMGYALIGLAAATPEGARGAIVYMGIYLIMNVGTFACILKMRREEGMALEISDLSGLARTKPALAAAIAIFMFSLAGIPPLAGFLGKFYVFLAAIDAGLTPLAIVGVIATVIGAYYYLRIVKVMYFDEPAPEFIPSGSKAMGLVVIGTALFNLFFFTFAAPILAWTRSAAAALFG